MAEPSKPSPPPGGELPADLEDALGDVLFRAEGQREERFEQLVREHPAHAVQLRARRAQLLEEDDVALHDGRRTDLSGKILSGKYRILRLRGEGGLGSVWEARDEMLGASVAVKVLHPRAARDHGALDRFLDEARLLTGLDHPNIVRWITFDRTSDGLHYFVMEYLAGEELAEVLRRETRMSADRTVAILLQVVAALRAAHHLPTGQSLLHLDLKPQNVFVLAGDPPRVKVIDFGMSQHVGAEARAAAGITIDPTQDTEGFDLTASVSSRAVVASATVPAGGRQVVRARGGTLLYASPEQCRHLAGLPDIVELDGRSDIYSLGIMAFQMLSGDLPYYHRPTPLEALNAHLKQKPRRLRDLGIKVPRRLEAFVARCLAKDRNDRFPDIEAAEAELLAIAKPPSRVLAFAAAALIFVAIALVLLWPDRPLDPFDVVADGNSVYLGPEQPVQRLALRNLADRDVTRQVRIVGDVLTNAGVIAGCRARLVDNGPDGVAVEIEAERDIETVERSVYLRVDGDRSQYSRAVRIAFLAKSAWEVRNVCVPDLSDRVLDPRGAAIEVQLRADPQWIAQVTVTHGQVVRSAAMDTARSRGDDLYFTLPFDKFTDLPEHGAATFRVDVEDRAKRHEVRVLELRLDARPLELAADLEGCFRAGNSLFVVYPPEDPVLVVQSTRAAGDMHVKVFHQDGRLLEVPSTPTLRGTQLALRGAAQGSFRGVIEVTADENGRVLHADPAHGRKSARVQFLCDAQRPALSVQMNDTTLSAGGAEPTYFTRGAELELGVRRSGPSVSVAVECRGAGGVATNAELDLHLEEAGSVRLPLPQDGVYRVAVRAYRYLGTEAQALENPEWEQVFVVVRDTTAPRIRVEGTASSVLRAWNAATPLATLRIDDVTIDAEHPTPVSLHWEICEVHGAVRAPASPQRWSGSLRDLVPVADATPLTCGELVAEPLADGDYVLRLSGADAAGNSAEAGPQATIAFQVANAGPLLSLQNPDGRWLPRPGNRFRVVVGVQDGNGVKSVTCTARSSTGGRIGPQALRPVDAASSQWETEFELPPSWSGARAELSCVARDAYDNESQLDPLTVQIDKFVAQRPAVVDLQLTANPAAQIGRMRLVLGADRYTYDGRSVREEQVEFRRHGLPFQRRTLVHYVRVADFYLDETEVTVAQFRAFVDAQDGYAAASNWEGSGPGEDRRQELAGALQRLTPDLPVTSIDWNEAAAYARWVGKRLPSAVEWEYTVRGGAAAYRPYSCAVPGRVPEPSTFNVDHGSRGDGEAWTVRQGSDVTPEGVGAGILDLCSNVSEWTQGDEDGERRLAVGASFASIGQAYHCFVKAWFARDVRAPHIGFRCAMDAAAVDPAVEGESSSRLRATAGIPAVERHK